MLIKRAPGIHALADKMRRNEFARLWSKTVRTLANNESSSQIRQLKLIYLATSDFSMVLSNYDIGTSNSHMMTEENFKAVKISSALSSEFTNITDLRNALFSPKMYEYPKLFDYFVLAWRRAGVCVEPNICLFRRSNNSSLWPTKPISD